MTPLLSAFGSVRKETAMVVLKSGISYGIGRVFHVPNSLPLAAILTVEDVINMMARHQLSLILQQKTTRIGSFCSHSLNFATPVVSLCLGALFRLQIPGYLALVGIAVMRSNIKKLLEEGYVLSGEFVHYISNFKPRSEST